VALTVGFVAVCWLLGRTILYRGADWLLRLGDGDLTLAGFSTVLLVVLLTAATTNAIGIFSIFGPFVLGAVLSDHDRLRAVVMRHLREIVYALFLPIFFTYTGLRTNVGLMTTWQDWLVCGLLLATATVGKMGGCGMAARMGGISWRESGAIALLMNTRALMGLIAINVGRELGVVPDTVFGMLVIMALATTFMTTPLLRRLLAGTESQLVAQ
jgi:Kef-type K+ transport system membrane component KefB